MKKSALALAVLGAFAGAASAQSSVTVFGVVDLSMRYVNNDEATYQLAQDGMASSRLGFRGIEDLGGGLKAGFWLEGAIGPDTGTGGASVGNGNVLTNAYQFRRRSTVSLLSQWGELRLGRDYTPQFWSWGVFDPFGLVGVGSAFNMALQAGLLAGSAGAYGTLLRADNTVQYILPNGLFGPGLYGQLMVAAGEASLGNKMYGGRIGYAAGPFDVAAAYSYTYLNPAVDATASNWNIGGSWNFGFLKLSAFFSDVNVQENGFADGGQQNWYVGAAAPFGQWNFKFSWGQADGTGSRVTTTPGVTSSNRGATQWALGADYNLSKRTAIYATVSSIDNNAYSNFRVAQGPGTAPNFGLTPGNSSTGGEVGVRHSF